MALNFFIVFSEKKKVWQLWQVAHTGGSTTTVTYILGHSSTTIALCCRTTLPPSGEKFTIPTGRRATTQPEPIMNSPPLSRQVQDAVQVTQQICGDVKFVRLCDTVVISEKVIQASHDVADVQLSVRSARTDGGLLLQDCMLRH